MLLPWNSVSVGLRQCMQARMVLFVSLPYKLSRIPKCPIPCRSMWVYASFYQTRQLQSWWQLSWGLQKIAFSRAPLLQRKQPTKFASFSSEHFQSTSHLQYFRVFFSELRFPSLQWGLVIKLPLQPLQFLLCLTMHQLLRFCCKLFVERKTCSLRLGKSWASIFLQKSKITIVSMAYTKRWRCTNPIVEPQKDRKCPGKLCTATYLQKNATMA